MPAALAGRAPVLLRAGRRIPRAFPAPSRSLTTSSLRAPISATRSNLLAKQPKRLGTVSVLRHYSAAVTDSAPNPKAYIESGVIKPQQSVDVKKVLVIGSGGLAIGQAGEFDYSGKQLTQLSRRYVDTMAWACDSVVAANTCPSSPDSLQHSSTYERVVKLIFQFSSPQVPKL